MEADCQQGLPLSRKAMLKVMYKTKSKLKVTTKRKNSSGPGFSGPGSRRSLLENFPVSSILHSIRYLSYGKGKAVQLRFEVRKHTEVHTNYVQLQVQLKQLKDYDM